MSNADKGAVGLIPALELASLTIRYRNRKLMHYIKQKVTIADIYICICI